MVEDKKADAKAESSTFSVPSITLPKGGPTNRGIGEKFSATPVTGTGSLSIPLAASPGRSGFGPQLALSYDSGSGNGPFGLGWSLSLPSITRKTDKGLPQYRDNEESDVFILSGAEDLVPVLQQDGLLFEDDNTAPDYAIRRYRPRIEGLFARIERWTARTTGEIHWRSISRDNVTTLYGKTMESRIADPCDPRRVFRWLICESYDDKGNAIVYRYAAENEESIDRLQANERSRVRGANRYLKRIEYGNRVSRLIQPDLDAAEWLFHLVFDYGDEPFKDLDPDPGLPDRAQHSFVRAAPALDLPWDASQRFWTSRPDPFSSYRAGFEVRTYRRCRRVLMYHSFAELGEEPCLVRSTDFDYRDLDYSQLITIEKELAHQGSTRFASFIRTVTHSGFVRDDTTAEPEQRSVRHATYLRKSMPPLDLEYSMAVIQDDIRELDAGSIENLPIGLDGTNYEWVDLNGEGAAGILTEQAGAWFYKPSLGEGRFGPLETVPTKPSMASLAGGRQQLLDLAGDGQLDLVLFSGSTPGFYEHTADAEWRPFRSFESLPNIRWDEPNLRFVDLNGDGHADVLIAEHEVFTWYPSLAEGGFEPARRAYQPLDEERGPRLVFADGTQSIYLTDMSGDGLTDLARVRNGEVCYWPNLGYGRFGAKVTMDDAPWFDNPEQFSQQRVRLADINGSGVSDIIYIGRDGVRLYFNQSGNRWSAPRRLRHFPRVDNLSSVMVADLLGNGTACLVWSSALPGDARRPLRYIDLMGGQKPHLLVKSVNNLGAETRVHYAPSTRFYLADKAAATPWITRLPFPVHVVERVETIDRISGNRFVTRYAFHHGYFDGVEREFRGFGMVEQWDTEEIGALTADGTLPAATNVDSASNVPPVLTKTWFHTGIFLGREHVSDFFAGLLDAEDKGEYYREPGLTDTQARALLLPDTVLPSGLTLDEEREACRALKGSMLRQEVYALDGTPKEEHPYTVSEQNFNVRLEQNRGRNRYAVFFAHPREAITYHYERNPSDPRVQHALTLEVDPFGNVLKEAAIGYGRRRPDPSLPLPVDRDKQTRTLITYTEHRVTNPIDDVAVSPDDYRTPLPSETRTFEMTGFKPADDAKRFRFEEWVRDDFALLKQAVEINYEETADLSEKQKRMIEHVRTLYRKNDLTDLLTLGTVESLAIPGENYKLAFTPGLAQRIYVDSGKLTTGDLDSVFANEGRYVHSEGDSNWWIPSGRIFLSPGSADTPAQELDHAHQHFFLPRRYRDPFHTGAVSTESFVSYDRHDLLMAETRDALGNRVTVGERKPDDTIDPTKPGNDYRVLQPARVMDPNRNRTQVAFDALGMVVGTSVMGKPEENLGDSLDGFTVDLTEAIALDHLASPRTNPNAILGRATTRLLYDMFAYQRTRDHPQSQAAVVYTLARETHDADLQPGEESRVQHSFSYSDGFGREIQKKIQAEPGPLAAGEPVVSPRWVGSGWTIFNNKGKPVRQYEPFFSATQGFEFGVQAGVSPILFYDPVERVVATLRPNHTYEKAVFDPWHQVTWDVNDTVLGDPRTDAHIQGYLAGYFANLPASPPAWETWYAQRQGGALGAQEQSAASKAAAHSGTPTTAHFDTLGRAFLTLADNGPDPAQPGQHLLFATRVELDIEGNQREVRDAIEQNGDLQGRIVMRYEYRIGGAEKEKETPHRIHQASMESGERWMLNDVTGKPIRAWDSRGHTFRTEYDELRRPLRSFVIGANVQNPMSEVRFEETVYGESIGGGGTVAQLLQANLRGKPYQHYDTAGLVTSEAYDFNGNLLRSTRQLAQDYKNTPDWSQDPPPVLETEIFASSTRYDALNRPIQLVAPHSNQPGSRLNVVQPGYNEANLLERVDAWLGQPDEPSTLLDPPSANLHAVTNIDYDAKGQRSRIAYGNGALTEYSYDDLTFRLIHLKTSRAGASVYQDLLYTYDPAGNITHIRDDAQQTIYFNGQVVLPRSDYAYDAIYRLIKATGREHIGQLGQPQTTWNDEFRVNLPQPGDGPAMRNYTEEYLYDAAGNFERLIHRAANGNWTRGYTYDEASLIEPARKSNRLSSTTVGATTEPYSFDAHGNMISMPHLTLMQWDFKDQLSATSRQAVNTGTRETTYYVYDAGGERVRKVTERDSGSRKEERVYLGTFEIYHEFHSNDTGAALERETLHVMDGKKRIALIETRTHGNDATFAQLVRFQLGNHIGSVSLELDGQAEIVSYEEYTPYGSTSYQAVRDQRGTPKRFRYTGKERDEESGLFYYGARYYLPWLGRWLSTDPAGIKDGANVYGYVQGRPVSSIDRHGLQSELVWPVAEADNKRTVTVLYGNTPGNVEHPPFLQQLYGSQHVEYYNTAYQQHPHGKFSLDEPNTFLQGSFQTHANEGYVFLLMKQKFRPDDKGFKLEALTAVESGMFYRKELAHMGNWFSLSANVSATAGITVADAKFAGGSGFTVQKPWYTVRGYSPVGFSATVVGRIDATFSKAAGFTHRISTDLTIFVAGNLHHYVGTDVKTSIGAQRVNYLGSGEITIGAAFTIGWKARSAFQRRHYQKLLRKK